MLIQIESLEEGLGSLVSIVIHEVRFLLLKYQ